MCDICRGIEAGMNPDEARAAYIDSLWTTINLYGTVLTGAEDAEPPYMYTVGRHLKGQPELLITGLDAPRMAAILNAASPRELTPGTRVDGLIEARPGSGVRYQMGVLEIDPDAAEMFVARHMMGPDMTALQLTWPDLFNRLPDEDGYASEWPQPVYPLVKS
jgi:hypothetical protein